MNIQNLNDIVLMPFPRGDREAATDIFNGYILSGTAAFPPKPVQKSFFDFLFEMPALYPAYILWDTQHNRLVGFCFLSPFHPQPTFRKTALVDYFLAPAYTGQGLGSLCLQRLEAEAKNAGIAHIIADISSENPGSIAFHKKHGFRQCGILENIGHKLGRDFSVIQMQKDI